MSTENKQQLKEKRLHGTSLFPCAGYHLTGDYPWILIKHHWHEEIEIIYMKQGRFRLDVNMESLEDEQECFLFINAQELHSLRFLSRPFNEMAIVFHPQMLHFSISDSVEEYILQPISSQALKFPRILPNDHPAFDSFKTEFFRVMDALRCNAGRVTPEIQLTTKDPVMQIQIKASLLQMIGILMRYHLIERMDWKENPKVESMKTVLSYISSNYHNKLYIGELARLINMNEQYFCRFFKKGIGKTPIEYINDYRLSKVIQLLETTEKPILEICLDCGFNNVGNFQKMFRRKTGTTPRQYRLRHASNSEREI